MKYLLGIDDTDNLESRGTGHRVHELADWLISNAVAEPHGITRHQLLVDPRIPYTSHNSSACIALDATQADSVWELSRQFLKLTSADGSDVGLCMASWEEVSAEVQTFGQRAKVELLTMFEAQQTASRPRIRCEGLTGTGGGIIGALAGVGLHRAGNDGRFLWLPGLRQLKGIYPVEELQLKGHIECVCTLGHEELSRGTLVNIGEWVRPVLKNGQSTLYVEEQNHEWHIISKDRIKSLSN
jgi:hypothetical protein